MEAFLRELLKDAIGGQQNRYPSPMVAAGQQWQNVPRGYVQPPSGQMQNPNALQPEGYSRVQDNAVQNNNRASSEGNWRGSLPPENEGNWRGSLPPDDEGNWRGSLPEKEKIRPEDEILPEVEHGGELLKTLTKSSDPDFAVKEDTSNHITASEARRGIVLAEILGPPRCRCRFIR
jgi:hypothetical protein